MLRWMFDWMPPLVLVTISQKDRLLPWGQVIRFSNLLPEYNYGIMPTSSFMYRSSVAGIFRVFALLHILVCLDVGFSIGQHRARSISYQEVLELGTKENFIKAEEVSCDSKGSIFVTDSYQYAIKKFDSRGSLVQTFGKRGKNSSEFKTFPYKIACAADTLALVELGSSEIHFLTPGFLSIGIASVGGPIVDIAFNTLGQLYVSMIPFSHRKEDNLILYDKSGQRLSTVFLTKARGEPAFDMVHLWVDSSNNLFVAYRYVNNITVYNNHQKMISSFRVAGLPDESPSEKFSHKELGSFPEGVLIQDISVDRRGNIFILSGDYAQHPQRDVFVYDYGGNPVANILLPDKTGLFFIDSHGFLYTREKQRRVIKKYRLTYVNF